MTSQRESLKWQKNISRETSSSFDSSKLKIDDFLRFILAFAKLPPLFQNAAPATTFNTVSGGGTEKRKRYLHACHKTQPKARDLRGNRRPAHQADHMFVTVCERRPTVRLSDLIAGHVTRLRSLKQPWANMTPTPRHPSPLPQAASRLPWPDHCWLPGSVQRGRRVE